MEHQRSRGSAATRAMLVLASLSFNVFLAVWLWRHESARPSTPVQPARDLAVPNQHSPAPTSAKPTALTAVETNLPVPFRWDEVESADYRQYIANLRAIGCPEQIIRDIILADVGQLFGSRAAAVWQPQVGEYWQKNRYESPGSTQVKQLGALVREHNAVLRELLGNAPGMQSLIDTLYLQVHGSEQQLLFLPPDKREAALSLLSTTDLDVKEAELRSRGYKPSDERKLFDEKAKALAEVLSTEEVEELKLRYSPTAQQLQMEMEYFNCTPEEFKKLVAAREQTPDGKGARADMIDRTGATEEVRNLFGDERAKEFQRTTDMFYINTRRAAEKEGIALDRVEQAWQLTRDARTAATRIAKDNTLTTEQRRSEVQGLLQQTETQLVDLLGNKASTAVRRDLRVVMLSAGPGLR